jgi:hypothetical protein
LEAEVLAVGEKRSGTPGMRGTFEGLNHVLEGSPRRQRNNKGFSGADFEIRNAAKKVKQTRYGKVCRGLRGPTGTFPVVDDNCHVIGVGKDAFCRKEHGVNLADKRVHDKGKKNGREGAPLSDT